MSLCSRNQPSNQRLGERSFRKFIIIVARKLKISLTIVSKCSLNEKPCFYVTGFEQLEITSSHSTGSSLDCLSMIVQSISGSATSESQYSPHN